MLVSLALSLAGCAGVLLQPGGGGSGAAPSAGEPELSAAVRSLILAEGLVDRSSLRILNNRGYLTLSGIAVSERAAARAEQIARDYGGVRGVANRLTTQ